MDELIDPIPNLSLLTYEDIVFPTGQVSKWYNFNNGTNLAYRLLTDLPTMNQTVLRLLCYDLFTLGVKLSDLQTLLPVQPEWYFDIGSVHPANLLIALRYGLNLVYNGTLVLWYSINSNSPIDHIIWDAIIHLGVDLNMPNTETGETLLQGAIRMQDFEFVKALICHGVKYDLNNLQLAIIHLDTNEGLQILKLLSAVGVTPPKELYQQIRVHPQKEKIERYLMAGKLHKIDLCSSHLALFEFEPSYDRSLRIRPNVPHNGNLVWPFYEDMTNFKIHIIPYDPRYAIQPVFVPDDDEIYQRAYEGLI
jgi:hypothetical protein